MDDLSVLNMYWDIERRLGETLATGRRDKFSGIVRDDGSYIMVPFHPVTFATVLDKAGQLLVEKRKYPDHRKRFVDVGAGAGFKVFMAEKMGFQATGIEFDEKYVDFGRNLLGLTGEDWSGKLIHQDALKTNYKDFDIIYFYRPIRDEEGQAKLEERILSTMRDDAIVIGVMPAILREKMHRVEYRNKDWWADTIFHKKGCEKHFVFEKVKVS